MRGFEFGGYHVPSNAYVNYSSWASHRLPEVFPEPEAFIPDRFTRERKAALPRGAYVPFGGGSRICIGKRFGQTEVKLVATMMLQRMRMELMPGPHDHDPPDAHPLARRRSRDAGPRAGAPRAARLSPDRRERVVLSSVVGFTY